MPCLPEHGLSVSISVLADQTHLCLNVLETAYYSGFLIMLAFFSPVMALISGPKPEILLLDVLAGSHQALPRTTGSAESRGTTGILT